MSLLIKSAARVLLKRIDEFENRLESNIKRAFENENGKKEFLEKYDEKFTEELDVLFNKIFYIATKHHLIEERIQNTIELLMEENTKNSEPLYDKEFDDEYSDENE